MHSLETLSWNEVCKELKTIKSKWYDFGINLGVPRDKLCGFKDEINPLSEVLGYWCAGNISSMPVTWVTIVAILRETEEPGLANKIENKYCQTGNYFHDVSTRIQNLPYGAKFSRPLNFVVFTVLVQSAKNLSTN